MQDLVRGYLSSFSESDMDLLMKSLEDDDLEVCKDEKKDSISF